MTFKHLLPYLPDVTCSVGDSPSEKIKYLYIEQNRVCFESGKSVPISAEYFKMNLRPFSDLLSSGCFVEIESASESEMNMSMWVDLRIKLERCEKTNSNIDVNRMPSWVVEILLKYRFDIFGLIDKDQANDINTLK